MALQGPGRLVQAESSRTLIYVSQRIAGDSAFPFKARDQLLLRIEGSRLIVEKAAPARSRSVRKAVP